MVGENKRVSAIDPSEVGIFPAHLWPVTTHAVLIGPKAVSGRESVDLVENHAGTKVDEIVFNSVVILDISTTPNTPVTCRDP